DMIRNIGPVPLEELSAVYARADALFMPTLLESFSGAYVEAMSFRKTILTSDRDFAREICSEAAFYFDPLDVDSIIEAIEAAFSDEAERSRRIALGTSVLAAIPDWSMAYQAFMELLSEQCSESLLLPSKQQLQANRR
ncbi:MAG: glycosyltransferase, partial [Bdellovibrionales bacterium]|nr:glycosyltransferase [Bdellovibrionales bacterium]